MPSARAAVIQPLAEQASRFPLMPALEPDTAGLDARDSRLAVAIHRATLRHWLTLHHLLNRKLRQRLERMDPVLRAILLSGAAQLLYMRRLPDHAVVDEAVGLARHHFPRRPGMAKLTNAVLRRIAELVDPDDVPVEWVPARNLLPIPEGALRLREPALPDPDDLDRHLSVATSHPVQLVRAWAEQCDDDTLRQRLAHSLKQAPTILNVPNAATLTADERPEPHAQPGFYLWRGSHAELLDHLRRHPDRWVQDPTAAAPVNASTDTEPHIIIDYCAGRGTKARQLAQLHPDATVLATDPDDHRFEQLQALAADHPGIEAVPHERIRDHAGTADLLVLDVPCSNTGVLARRLEARYRYRRKTLDSLIALQQSILRAAAPLLKRDDDANLPRLLYSTCSLEPAENEHQARWAMHELNMRTLRSEAIAPAGDGPAYHDGGYYALLGPA